MKHGAGAAVLMTLFLDNREVRREALRPGMAVTLRVHPRTGEVWEARARTQAPRAPVGSS